MLFCCIGIRSVIPTCMHFLYFYMLFATNLKKHEKNMYSAWMHFALILPNLATNADRKQL